MFNMLGSTISSLIAASPHTSSALSLALQSAGIIPTTPLSPAAIKISRDGRLLDHLMPKVGQEERMLLLNWFLEEEKLKQYEVFKSEFLEDPDEYTYALSSLLGTFMWDVTPVNPTIGTFMGPNSMRRTNLYPFQAALTEKWKAIGKVFSHSWNNALDKSQREALIMRSFIDTANINKDMTDARRQSFDLRTSELSGRGFIPFMQEHLLQNTMTPGSGTQVSLPHTENMVRVFKDWVEKSGSTPEDDNNDTLFRRSCALSLRDKCIYSRALFATRLCITVLEMWEKIIRTVEEKRGGTTKSNDVAIEYPPVSTVTEVEASAKQTKPKKKKKAKSAKKARRLLTDTEVDAQPATENSGTELQTIDHNCDTLDFAFEDDFAAASGTDESKSSGASSPTGTGGEGSKLPPAIKAEVSIGKRDAECHVAEETGHANIVNSTDRNGGICEIHTEGSETIHGRHGHGFELGHGDNVQLKIAMDSEKVNSQGVPATNAISPEIDSSFQIWEEFPDQLEAEWLPVKGKKRKGQSGENNRTGPNNRNAGRRSIAEGRQSDASLNVQKPQGNYKYSHKPAQVQAQSPSVARPPPQSIRGPAHGQLLITNITIQPSTPANGQQPKTTIINQPSTPITNQPTNPINERPSTPTTGQQNTSAKAQSPKTTITNQSSVPITIQPSKSIKGQPSTPITNQPSTLIEKVEDRGSDIDTLTIDAFNKPVIKSAEIEVKIHVKETPSTEGLHSSQVDTKHANIASPIEATRSTNDATRSTNDATPAAPESELTHTLTSVIASVKGKKHKSQKKRSKSISKEQSTEYDSSLPDHDLLPSPEPLKLENVTFFCAVCHRPRGYHHSVQCSLCGPESTIRYCSPSCQRQDMDHWRLCGLSPFPVPILVSGNTVACRPSTQRVSWMTPAFARQRMLLADQPDIDYFLFNTSADSPKYNLIIHDEKLKQQFTKLRQKMFQQRGSKAVTLLYRVIKSQCQEMDIKVTPEDLASQLYSEFGFNPLLSSTSKDLRITPQDWLAAGVHLKGDTTVDA